MNDFNLKEYLKNNPLLQEDLRDVADEIEAAGIYLDDGILGGVGSGGGGYYDWISDKISGYHIDKFNEEEFDNWYDNFSKDSFNSFRYEKEDAEIEEWEDMDWDGLFALGVGIHAIADMGFVEIHDNGDVELFAAPILASGDNINFDHIFGMDGSGNIIPLIDKEELRIKLSANTAPKGEEIEGGRWMIF